MRYFLSTCLVLSVTGCFGPTPPPPPPPVDICAHFSPSGYMGDINQITMEPAPDEDSPRNPVCTKVSYTPGPVGFGGVYWMNRPRNWCVQPGGDFSKKGYSRLTFWAKGERGRERVEFKAGGIRCDGMPYKDSFETSLGTISLTTGWRMFTIDLQGNDLSSVIGGFCWVASARDNPDGLQFFIDDIHYE